MLIAADDRTGALEVAGACCDEASNVVVSVWGNAGFDGVAQQRDEVHVLDLGTRDLGTGAAIERARAVAHEVTALKIDSRLRGNWAVEARALAHDRPIWVVAALPSMHRVCRGGAVSEYTTGELLGRPAESLPDAVVWDAATSDDLARIGEQWRSTAPSVRPLFLGTSAAIAALRPTARPIGVELEGPIVLACGSRHPSARRELRELGCSDACGVVVLSTDDSVELDPLEAARDLAAHVHAVMAGRSVATLFVIGGATAAAVLGDDAVRVGGLVAPGVPWARRLDGAGPLIVTRSGGFNGAASIAALLPTTRPESIDG
jgi:uncharacterized protein YgbK (DUF1537 family)